MEQEKLFSRFEEWRLQQRVIQYVDQTYAQTKAK